MEHVTSEVGLQKAQVLEKRKEIIAGLEWAGLSKACTSLKLKTSHGFEDLYFLPPKEKRALGLVVAKRKPKMTSVQPEVAPVESETVSPPVVHSWPEQGQEKMSHL